MVPEPSGVVSPKTPTQGRRGSRPLLIRSKPRHSHPQDEATSATTSAHSSSPMTIRTTASASTHHMDNRSPSKSLRRSKSSKWQDQLLRYQAFRRKVPFTDLSLSPQPSQPTQEQQAAQKQRRRQQYKDQKRAFLNTSASSLLTTHTTASAATTATTATATTSTEELPPRPTSGLSSRNLMQQQRQEHQQLQQQQAQAQQQLQQQQSFLQPLQASPSGLSRQQMMVLQQQLDTLQEHYLSLLTEKETQQSQLRLAVEQWKMLQQTYQQQRMENQQLVEQKESMNQLQQQLNVLIRQQQQAYQHHLAETQSNLHQAQRALEQSQGKVVHLQKQAKALQARLRKETQAEQQQQQQQQQHQQQGSSQEPSQEQQHSGHQPQHRRLSSDSSHFQEEVKQLTRETNQLRAEQLATNAAYRRSGSDPKAPILAIQALQKQLDQAKATEQRQRLALELERQNSFRLTKQLSTVHMEKEQLQQELEILKQEVQNGSVGGGSSGGGGGGAGDSVAREWDLQRLKEQIQVLQSENQKQRKTIVELKNRSPTVVVVAEEEDDEMNSLDGVVEGQAHRHRKKHPVPPEELEDSMDSMSWQQSHPSGLNHAQDHPQGDAVTPQSPPTTAQKAPQGPPDTIDFTDALSERRNQSRTLVQITSMFLPTPSGGGSGGGTPPEHQHKEPLASSDDNYFPPMSPSPRSQPRYIKAALSGRAKELEQSLSTFTTVSELTMPEDDLLLWSAKRSQPKGSVLANGENGDDDDDDNEGDLKNNVSALLL